MTYEAPKLTKYGSIGQITSSDIKCSVGVDHGYGTRWSHPTSQTYTEWSNGSNQKTAGELIRSGCKWEMDLTS